VTADELLPHGWNDATLDLMARELKEWQATLMESDPSNLSPVNLLSWAIRILLLEEDITGDPPVSWRLFRLFAEMQRLLEQEVLYRRLGVTTEPVPIRELVRRSRA
jgi:hypothetical protein